MTLATTYSPEESAVAAALGRQPAAICR